MAESYPTELRYHQEHDWARVDGDTATFGITWYAQDNLQEIVFVDLPAVGDEVTKDEPYAEVESLKAVSDIYAPLSGQVVEVNDRLTEEAYTINDDPYGNGWLVKVRMNKPSESTALLSADEYQTSLAV